MVFKKIAFLFLCLAIVSCSEDTDITVPRTLQEYIATKANVTEKTVVACAASAVSNTSTTYIFYYPEEGATDIRYYELTSPDLDKDNFENYRRESLDSEAVFGGKLGRFTRTSEIESWCLVTYVKENELRISEPIKINNQSKATEYSNDVEISYKSTVEPNFTWNDGAIDENVIYFEVISDEENEFISGTYTTEKFFQYYDESNVLASPKLNEAAPRDLVEDEIYNFTMMGVSEDNWVNLIIQDQFIPQNLSEYIAKNSDKTTQEDAIAFAGSANGNAAQTNIYFYPLTGAYDYRYYETADTTVDPLDYSNYTRRNFTSAAQFGGKFRRFTNEVTTNVYCLVTYLLDDKLYISKPIKTKNATKPTEWSTAVDITYPNTLAPVFTWQDGTYTDTDKYFEVLTLNDDTFLTGTYTKDKQFVYYNESNIIVADNIHTSTPPVLVLDDSYKLYIYGLDTDNWLNLVIQNTFIAQ